MMRLLVFLTAIGVALAGCQSLSLRKSTPVPGSGFDGGDADLGATGPGLQPATQKRFDDVPLPIGVTEDLERSYVYESASLQVGRMVYSTRNSLNELAAFYINECAASGWDLESVLQAGGYEMIFRKPDKRLTVTIRNLGVRRGRMLILNYTPEGGASVLR